MEFTCDVLGNIDTTDTIETILSNRGIRDTISFMNPTEKHLEDPFLFDNIEKARDCLLRHIKNKNKIIIVVDPDLDGNTASAFLVQYIHRISPDTVVDYIIHDEKQHGLNDLMEEIIGSDYKLVIVPDAGSNDYVECTQLYLDGKEVIILDHHEVEPITKLVSVNQEGWVASEQPAILVNNQTSDKIKDKAMTGVGIVYKFCQVLDQHLDVNYSDDYLDLVALGMVADLCDLTNLQSRFLVLQGLEQMNKGINKNKLIKDLTKTMKSSIGKKITINDLSFYIAPLINSMIRFGSYEDKRLMFEAFCNSDRNVKSNTTSRYLISVQQYVRMACLETLTKQREETERLSIELVKNIEKFNLNSYPIIVCDGTGLVGKRMTGLTANKIASIYHKPTLILKINMQEHEGKVIDYCSGSGRGFPNSNIKDFKQWCIDTGLFIFALGHDNAFGATLLLEKTNNLYELLSTMENTESLNYIVDAKFTNKNLSSDLIKKIHSYNDVWGTTVKEPLFLIEDITINTSNIKLIGEKRNTIKFTYRNMEFIKFRTDSSEYDDILRTGDDIKFTIVGKFSINEFRGKVTPQIIIENMMYEKGEKSQSFIF